MAKDVSKKSEQSGKASLGLDWPDYAAIWRWHFYAGLLCLPIVCWLATTGSIYLFRPQFEAFVDSPYDNLASAQTATPSQVVDAALKANPGWTLHDYQLPAGPSAAAQVLIGRDGAEHRLWIDRGSLKILKSVPEDRRFMNLIFHLHGELLLGDQGSAVVELTACWTIVMIITGLYLWWPRGARGLAGIVYPRLSEGRRFLWRDLHAVTGIWISAFALFLLISGLPWTANWGNYLTVLRALPGKVSHIDWATGSASELAARRAKDAAGMANMPGMGTGISMVPIATGWTPLDRIVPTVAAMHLPPPVLVSPPANPGEPWTARSDTQNRPRRVNLKMDAATGELIERSNFNQQPVVDQVVGVGVAIHEGQMFGWFNQLLGIVTALGLVTMSVSAVVLWWRRKPQGVLGAPEPRSEPRAALPFLALVFTLGILMPLFGLSVIVVYLVERFGLRRWPAAQRWLGLRSPT